MVYSVGNRHLDRIEEITDNAPALTTNLTKCLVKQKGYHNGRPEREHRRRSVSQERPLFEKYKGQVFPCYRYHKKQECDGSSASPNS